MKNKKAAFITLKKYGMVQYVYSKRRGHSNLAARHVVRRSRLLFFNNGFHGERLHQLCLAVLLHAKWVIVVLSRAKAKALGADSRSLFSLLLYVRHSRKSNHEKRGLPFDLQPDHIVF